MGYNSSNKNKNLVKYESRRNNNTLCNLNSDNIFSFRIEHECVSSEILFKENQSWTLLYDSETNFVNGISGKGIRFLMQLYILSINTLAVVLVL